MHYEHAAGTVGGGCGLVVRRTRDAAETVSANELFCTQTCC